MLELLRSISPVNKLVNSQLDVLAELLYFNYVYKNIDKVIRCKILFDYETKNKMKEYLGMGNQSFDNVLTALRKKNIITSRGLVSDFGIDPDNKDINLIFNFKIND